MYVSHSVYPQSAGDDLLILPIVNEAIINIGVYISAQVHAWSSYGNVDKSGITES